MLLEFLFGILGDRVLIGDAFGHLPVELGELAMLLLKQLLHIDHAIARQLGPAYHGVGGQVGEIRTDAFGEARPQTVDVHHVPAARFLAADGGVHLLATTRKDAGRARIRRASLALAFVQIGVRLLVVEERLLLVVIHRLGIFERRRFVIIGAKARFLDGRQRRILIFRGILQITFGH